MTPPCVLLVIMPHILAASGSKNGGCLKIGEPKYGLTPGSTTGLSGTCEMQILAPEAVAGKCAGSQLILGSGDKSEVCGSSKCGCIQFEAIPFSYFLSSGREKG